MNEKKIVWYRDCMVFLVQSITEMLESARWTVYSDKYTYEEISKQFQGIEKINPLMNYEITCYNNDELDTVYLIPLLQNGHFAVCVVINRKDLKMFQVSETMGKEFHEEIVTIHEYILTSLNQKPIKGEKKMGKKYIVADMLLLNANDREALLKSAGAYQSDEFELFLQEYGWEPWMQDFTTARDEETCSENELNIINEIMRQAWKEAHKCVVEIMLINNGDAIAKFNDYVHSYSDMAQLVNDYFTFKETETTQGWENNQPEMWQAYDYETVKNSGAKWLNEEELLALKEVAEDYVFFGVNEEKLSLALKGYQTNK